MKNYLFCSLVFVFVSFVFSQSDSGCVENVVVKNAVVDENDIIDRDGKFVNDFLYAITFDEEIGNGMMEEVNMYNLLDDKDKKRRKIFKLSDTLSGSQKGSKEVKVNRIVIYRGERESRYNNVVHEYSYFSNNCALVIVGKLKIINDNVSKELRFDGDISFTGTYKGKMSFNKSVFDYGKYSYGDIYSDDALIISNNCVIKSGDKVIKTPDFLMYWLFDALMNDIL